MVKDQVNELAASLQGEGWEEINSSLPFSCIPRSRGRAVLCLGDSRLGAADHTGVKPWNKGMWQVQVELMDLLLFLIYINLIAIDKVRPASQSRVISHYQHPSPFFLFLNKIILNTSVQPKYIDFGWREVINQSSYE